VGGGLEGGGEGVKSCIPCRVLMSVSHAALSSVERWEGGDFCMPHLADQSSGVE